MKYGWIFSGIIPSNPLVHRKDPLKAPLTLLAATWRNNLQLFRSGRIHASFCHNDGIGKHIPDRCHEFCEALPLFEFHRVWIPVVIGGMPGWQIALIAVGAALLAATVAVLLDRARVARRNTVAAAA